ncbi:acyloxyacyl hydrolase [Geobacter sp. SVR]|uniref:acyloxyacyl hydrolase n=1 Tax=Geobacter sp. SVR TaxID=2495594 RepID=UPI00143EF7BB|nr:acyloxyacyl hydrolase [Geobacter sp. SVR]BCS54291.1 lipid A 3-O-deacylase [Geobacter sp. SVR]GCF85850.1 lipid A 3-O-deacylase [Geobacter sp. SVR]
MKTIATLATVVMLLIAIPQDSSAGNPVSLADGEYGFLTGYGISHIGFGATQHQVQTWDAIARAGFFMSGELGQGHWYQGRHETVFELPYHMAVDHGGRSMVGFYVLGHWRFTGLESMAPYVFAGGGPVYVDLGLPTMGTKLCFSYQGGTGLQYFLDSSKALDLQYRYHHISNAGTAEPNEPLNSSKILMGISVFY